VDDSGEWESDPFRFEILDEALTCSPPSAVDNSAAVVETFGVLLLILFAFCRELVKLG
jgi:hypothetical protein